MMKSMWIYAVAAIVTIVASGASYVAGVLYLPGILMFVAAMIVLGLSMNIEDHLLARYARRMMTTTTRLSGSAYGPSAPSS